MAFKDQFMWEQVVFSIDKHYMAMDLLLCQLYARILPLAVHVVGVVFLVAFRRSPLKNSLRFNVIPKEKI